MTSTSTSWTTSALPAAPMCSSGACGLSLNGRTRSAALVLCCIPVQWFLCIGEIEHLCNFSALNAAWLDVFFLWENKVISNVLMFTHALSHLHNMAGTNQANAMNSRSSMLCCARQSGNFRIVACALQRLINNSAACCQSHYILRLLPSPKTHSSQLMH